jgi:hypothetical protein
MEISLVAGEGFEPSKAEPGDLQCASESPSLWRKLSLDLRIHPQ